MLTVGDCILLRKRLKILEKVHLVHKVQKSVPTLFLCMSFLLWISSGDYFDVYTWDSVWYTNTLWHIIVKWKEKDAWCAFVFSPPESILCRINFPCSYSQISWRALLKSNFQVMLIGFRTGRVWTLTGSFKHTAKCSVLVSSDQSLLCPLHGL